MKRVFLASPYAGDTVTHVAYAKRAMAHSLCQGEAPFLPHLLYPSVLDDKNPQQRAESLSAGLAWLQIACCLVVYTDYGISKGMNLKMIRARDLGMHVEERTIGKNQ